MAKEWAKKFYNSMAWKRTRKAYMNSVHGVCEKCGEPGLELHHIKELTPMNINDPEITLSWSNLKYLCFSCHQKETWGTVDVVEEGLEFNADGELVKTKAIPSP